jgi:hypothetical protein
MTINRIFGSWPDGSSRASSASHARSAQSSFSCQQRIAALGDGEFVSQDQDLDTAG